VLGCGQLEGAEAFWTSRELAPSSNRFKDHSLLEVSEWCGNVGVVLGCGPWAGGDELFGRGNWHLGETG
jgi:hypothetical protein